MPPFSTTAINKNSNVVVVVAGFCINQLPAFPLLTLRSTLGNILDAAVILFYFFPNSLFPYKTPREARVQTYLGHVENTTYHKALGYPSLIFGILMA